MRSNLELDSIILWKIKRGKSILGISDYSILGVLMIRIEGESDVRSFLAQKIREAEDELIADIRGIEKEFLTLVLGLIEGAIPRVDYPRHVLDYILSIKHDLVQVLDSLLRRGVLQTISFTAPFRIPGVDVPVSIGTIHPNDIKRAIDVLTRRFEALSAMKTLLLQCEISDWYSIEIDGDQNVLFDTAPYRNARDTWLNNSIRNSDWESYFFGNPENDLANFSQDIADDFVDLHGFRVAHLNWIRDLLNLLYQMGNPITVQVSAPFQFDYFGRFVTLPRDYIREYIKIKYNNLTEAQVDSFLDSLVYKGGYLPTRKPFFKIGTESSPNYFVWTSVPVFITSWVFDVMKDGAIGTKYGDTFDEYVRKRIRDNTSLVVHPTDLNIAKTRYSDMAQAFARYKRQSVQIDGLAWDNTRVYVISCKAHDMMFDEKIEARLLISPYSDFYSRAWRNYKEILEVCMWVDILQSSQEFSSHFNLGQKPLIPVIITPRPDPFQFTEVRDWFSSLRPSLVIPDCEVFAISDFETRFPIS